MIMFPVYFNAMTDIVGPPQITGTPTNFDFYQPLSIAPVITKPNLGPATVMGWQPLPPITPSTWDWYQPLSVPPVGTKPNVGASLFFPAQSPPITVTPANFDFFQPLSIPTVETKVNFGPAWVYGQPFANTLTPSNFDFYQPLSLVPVGTKVNIEPGIWFVPNPNTPNVVVNLIDTHDGGPKKKKRKTAEFKLIDREVERRARNRARIIDTFERVVEGKIDPPEDFVAKVEQQFAENVPNINAMSLNLNDLLTNAAAIERLWREYLEADDEDVLMLL